MDTNMVGRKHIKHVKICGSLYIYIYTSNDNLIKGSDNENTAASSNKRTGLVRSTGANSHQAI